VRHHLKKLEVVGLVEIADVRVTTQQAHGILAGTVRVGERKPRPSWPRFCSRVARAVLACPLGLRTEGGPSERGRVGGLGQPGRGPGGTTGLRVMSPRPTKAASDCRSTSLRVPLVLRHDCA
jgi:hypothetical protein